MLGSWLLVLGCFGGFAHLGRDGDESFRCWLADIGLGT